jgi:rsbT antagonist protein RsbS
MMIVAGIQPGVAFAMVQLGATLPGVATALDLDHALALMTHG